MDERTEIKKTILKYNMLRLMKIFVITILSIQLILSPVSGKSVDHKKGHDVISHDNGITEVISGALNYQKWDGTYHSISELNISTGDWPYLFSENESSAKIGIDDTILIIPKENAKIKPRLNSFGYEIKFSKSELQGKKLDINVTDAFLDFPFDLKSRTPGKKIKDDYTIKEGRLQFKGGPNKVIIHDDTLRDYIEGGEVVQDVTYLIPPEYDLLIEDGKIRLKFKKNALDKLNGNITIDIQGWSIAGASDPLWGSDTTFSNTAEVRATGNVELKQKVTDYVMYTRFDEGASTTIHNENPNIPFTDPIGDLLGTVVSGTWTSGKYGQAIHFDGVKNKVLFNDDPELRLPYDFTISYYIRLTSDVDNQDSDITRKGSTATADPDKWYKVEIKTNKMQGVVFNDDPSEIAEKDTVDRRDGNWHFVAYTRQGNTCSLIVDGTTVAYRNNCPTNTVNSAQLAIGAKDTETSGTGKDYTHGTIDEVRFFKRKLTSSEFTSIRNNEHFTSGTITRNLASVIGAGQEVKGLACDGAWTKPTMKVDVQASVDNVNWNTIQSNADPNVLYSVPSGNNYRYSRCSLSTTDSSKTPEISSLRATIGPIGTATNLIVFMRGTDQGLWYNRFSGSSWGTWTSLGGIVMSNISSVIMGSDTYVFVRGLDNGLYYKKLSGSTWSSWMDLGGTLSSDPEAVVSGSDLYVFARDSSNSLMYIKLSGTTWSGWTGLGGILSSNPDASVLGSELYVFGLSNNGLWYRKLSGSTWGSWTSLGGILAADPEFAPNDVFVRGTDQGIWYRRLSGGAFLGWASLGGIATSNPDAVPNDVFVRGTDSAIWHNKWSGSSWSGWQSLGGISASEPEAVTAGTDTYLFVRGSDNALWYKKQTGGTWGSWTNLGGIFSSSPSAAAN